MCFFLELFVGCVKNLRGVFCGVWGGFLLVLRGFLGCFVVVSQLFSGLFFRACFPQVWGRGARTFPFPVPRGF